MLQAANSMADELLGTPMAAKNSELRKLKSFNPALHGMVEGTGNAAVGQMQQGN